MQKKKNRDFSYTLEHFKCKYFSQLLFPNTYPLQALFSKSHLLNEIVLLKDVVSQAAAAYEATSRVEGASSKEGGEGAENAFPFFMYMVCAWLGHQPRTRATTPVAHIIY